MTNTNATNLRKNLFEYLSQAINFNDVINVSTKNGNAIILSAEDYSGLMETVYLMSNPQVMNDIMESKEEPLEQGSIYDPSEEW
ncbi:MAG: type II toxin-antitoxin system Phd/YefM family antitoxin [Bacilli bacterium]|nr:type II toxin-antitoxin system Phd/YefM family antitoxin [Bacilli bacterium]